MILSLLALLLQQNAAEDNAIARQDAFALAAMSARSSEAVVIQDVQFGRTPFNGECGEIIESEETYLVGRYQTQELLIENKFKSAAECYRTLAVQMRNVFGSTDGRVLSYLSAADRIERLSDDAAAVTRVDRDGPLLCSNEPSPIPSGLPVVHAQIRGYCINVAVDTGATFSLFDIESAQTNGDAAASSIFGDVVKGSILELPEIYIASYKIVNVPVFTPDTAEQYLLSGGISGIIGLTALWNLSLVWDGSNLLLEEAGYTSGASSEVVPIAYDGSSIRVSTEVNGLTMSCKIDTFSMASVVPRSVWESTGEQTVSVDRTMTVTGLKNVERASFVEFRVGSVRSGVSPNVQPTEVEECVVGWDFLRSFNWRLDVANNYIIIS